MTLESASFDMAGIMLSGVGWAALAASVWPCIRVAGVPWASELRSRTAAASWGESGGPDLAWLSALRAAFSSRLKRAMLLRMLASTV